MSKFNRCGIFLFNPYEETLVLVRGTKSGIWSAPKGSMNEIELRMTNSFMREAQCASRETFEECGIKISPRQLLQCKRCKINYTIYFIYPIFDPLSFHINDTEEICEVEQVPINELSFKKCNCDLRLLSQKKSHILSSKNVFKK